jgi:hypothetical protein
MKAGFAAGLLAVLLAAPARPQQLSGGEKIESGELPSPSGLPLLWRIRLLPVASFPDLPPAVAAQLGLRQCMIPQSFEAQQPENVIRGSFRAPGSDDWAVLCSVREATTLYVFFGGQFDAPVALRSQHDTDWLGAEPGSHIFGSAWGIALSRAEQLRASPQLREALQPDHDGIQDERLERTSTIHYYQNGKWVTVAGGG